MAEEFRSGLMAQDMKAIGETTKQMATVDSFMRMVTYMKETGRMIRLMEMEYILMLMDPDTKVNGLKINSMVRV